MLLTADDRLLFIGDSITDAGRDYTDSTSLGNGYVREIARALRSGDGPGQSPTVINKGINGERVYDLETRWTTDVIDQRPTVVTVKIGINDTWRRYDGGILSPVDEFESCLDRILSRTTRDLAARLLVITPFLLPVTPDQETWHEDLSPRTEAVLRTARSHGAEVVRADVLLPRAAEEFGRAALAPDGVHPSPQGHELLAEAWLAKAESAVPRR
ncbi:SGNH/GDSL hydrolase family protein [Streptomyces sp. NPDC048560]|uniref:SGNH/GDSL hydrolase family protein n=1 Tax=Streptomyces sp. NPDC048560 TaxID=3155488 RepID=UPI0034458C18